MSSRTMLCWVTAEPMSQACSAWVTAPVLRVPLAVPMRYSSMPLERHAMASGYAA